MINKVLIANRGEIACRIIDSVQAAGLSAVAIYSDADRDSLFVSLADEGVALGGNTPSESYLDINKVITAALAAGADAVHPGYGFLSENSQFAQACADNNLTFIGPSPHAIEVMGNKASAKALMLAAGVPCVPGYQGEDQSDDLLVAEAKKIGLPMMVKAAAGGGGRGMRLVTDESNLVAALASARAEALSAFGSDQLILEKAIVDGRHIEIQIAGDQHGQVIHLGERDCSAQRRHQKVIEECPSPFVDESLRSRMGEAAVNAARAVNYEGVGTVEFLVDAEKNFYFLEMNTRLQVEHPVTELVTDTDLVDWQLQIANGEPLPLSQSDVSFDGHAIEVRIYAEDPANDFMPQTGRVAYFEPGDNVGVRIDHGIYSGAQVTPYYDAMLAKLICWGRNREEARRRLLRALSQTRLLGLLTNKAFLSQLLTEPAFIAGAVTTGFINPSLLARLDSGHSLKELALAGALLAGRSVDASEPFANKAALAGWSNTAPMPIRDRISLKGEEIVLDCLAQGSGYAVTVNGETQVIVINSLSPGRVTYTLEGVSHEAAFMVTDSQISIDFGTTVLNADITTYAPVLSRDAAGSGQINATTEGLVVDVLVKVGDTVARGETLVIVEAMKMQHRHVADGDGEVLSISVTTGMQVKNRQPLAELRLVADSEQGNT